MFTLNLKGKSRIARKKEKKVVKWANMIFLNIVDHWTESYSEEEHNLFFEKLCYFFTHISWKSPCCLWIVNLGFDI